MYSSIVTNRNISSETPLSPPQDPQEACTTKGKRIDTIFMLLDSSINESSLALFGLSGGCHRDGRHRETIFFSERTVLTF
jgi:hypothetical protein